MADRFFQYPWRLLRERLAGVYRYAKKCGYSDDSLLRRAFKSATGMSLSEYRKSLAR